MRITLVLSIGIALWISACTMPAKGPQSSTMDAEAQRLAALMTGRWVHRTSGDTSSESSQAASNAAEDQTLDIKRLDKPSSGLIAELEATRTVAGQAPIILRHGFRVATSAEGVQQVSRPAPGSDLTVDAPCVIDWAIDGNRFKGRATDPGCAWMMGPASDDGAPLANLTLSETDFRVTTASADARFRRADTSDKDPR
ncbi:MAG: hypothetical protein AAGJ32_00665 [Pseudomonadota bacterium]